MSKPYTTLRERMSQPAQHAAAEKAQTMQASLTPDNNDSMELHIYGQEYPHDTAVIIGTPGALRKLANALTQALTCETLSTTGYFVADGEGFDIQIVRREDLQALVVPYTDPVFAGETSIWPYKR